ncbi:MAG: sulfurtransferase TusA family protein [Rhizobiaceae bacterium]|nr:sulfurtransferase TusA family protein [Rhizobiaceae bacterium]
MSSENIVLDLRGLKCPLPVLKTRKAMQPLASGTQLWVETTDPLAVIDIPAFCNENGHSLVETEERTDHHRFLLQKG